MIPCQVSKDSYRRLVLVLVVMLQKVAWRLFFNPKNYLYLFILIKKPKQSNAMDNQESKIIEDYVTKMLEIQKEQFEKPLTIDELREIAFSVGMTESDWKRSQEQMQQHIKTGQAHLKNRNWVDADLELKQALSIHPYHEDTLYGLAVANHEIYKQKADSSKRDQAKSYAEKVLKNEPQHLDNASIALLNDIRNTEDLHRRNRISLFVKIGIGLAAAIVIFLIFLSISSASVTGLTQSVNQKLIEVENKWGQVENVYQRRESLIPQIVNIAKVASKYDKSTLLEIENLKKSLNSGNKEDYMNTQNQISKKLNELLSNMEGNAQTMMDIKVQIEGSENRIRVEWKRYNDAVSAYNSAILDYNDAIGKFPNNLFGYKEKQKMKALLKK